MSEKSTPSSRRLKEIEKKGPEAATEEDMAKLKLSFDWVKKK